MSSSFSPTVPLPKVKYTPGSAASAVPAHTAQLPARQKATFLAGRRAVIQHNIHCDKRHTSTREDSGVHKNIHAVVKECEEVDVRNKFVKDTWTDILDASTSIDRTDGGFTLVLRCPGAVPPSVSESNVPIEDITLDAYIPPRELEDCKMAVEKPLSRIAQIFAQQIAVPHLHRVIERSKISGVPLSITAPSSDPPADSTHHLRLIPPSVEEGSTAFKLPARVPGQLEQYLETLSEAEYDCSNGSFDWTPGGEASIIHDKANGLIPCSKTLLSFPKPAPEEDLPHRATTTVSSAPRILKDPSIAPILPSPSLGQIQIRPTSSTKKGLLSKKGQLSPKKIDQKMLAIRGDSSLSVGTTDNSVKDIVSVFKAMGQPRSKPPSTASINKGSTPLDDEVSALEATNQFLASGRNLLSLLRSLESPCDSENWVELQREKRQLDRELENILHSSSGTNIPPIIIRKVLRTRGQGKKGTNHMVLHVVEAAKKRRVQGIRSHAPRPRLTKEAREQAKRRRQEASLAYCNDIDKATENFNQIVGEITSDHKKSVRAVQLELRSGRGAVTCTHHKKTSAWHAWCWKQHQLNKPAESGPRALQSVVRNTCSEYSALTEEERAELITEFEEYKATKVTGTRVSNRSKVNDTTYTLSQVEKELNNLRSRMGVESLLVASRRTTDVGIRAVSFTTEGVTNFLPDVMKVDEQDLAICLEGYAVQGIAGSARNARTRFTGAKKELHGVINSALAEATDNVACDMKWRYYWRDIVKEYLVIVEGWPPEIEFGNLSSVATSLPKIETLLTKWRTGATYFRKLTAEEFRDLDNERNRRIEAGEITAPARKTRSDKGKSKRSGSGPKSAKVIENSDTDDGPRGTSIAAAGPSA